MFLWLFLIVLKNEVMRVWYGGSLTWNVRYRSATVRYDYRGFWKRSWRG